MEVGMRYVNIILIVYGRLEALLSGYKYGSSACQYPIETIRRILAALDLPEWTITVGNVSYMVYSLVREVMNG